MPEGFDANPDFIEARYVAGTNQYDLELLAAAPEIVDFGTGGSASDGGGSSGGSVSGGSFASSPAGIEQGTQGGGGVGCPALDQYVLGLNESGSIAVKLAGLLKGDDFLYNPLTTHFNRVKSAEILENQKCCRIKTNCGAEMIVSESHPVIQTFRDCQGNSAYKLKQMFFGEICIGYPSALSCGNTGYAALVTAILSIEDAGVRDVMHITLETEFIYAVGNSGDQLARFILGHNFKPFPEPRDGELQQ